MQQYDLNIPATNVPHAANTVNSERHTSGLHIGMQEAARAAERARLRQGIMHVRIRHFYCTLEEIFDPTLRGQSFVAGTATGPPNEPAVALHVPPPPPRPPLTPALPFPPPHPLPPQ